MMRVLLSAMFLAIVICGRSPAEEAYSPDKIRVAIRRAIPLLEKGSAGSAEQRKCFTCHSQAMPILALSRAQQRGFVVDEANFNRQMQHTSKHLEGGRQRYLEGKGQGGRVVTAGYALWALDSGGYQPDKTTSAVTGFLLQYQQKADHWRQPGRRPPTSGSDFTATYVALRGLAKFSTPDQRPRVHTRMSTVRSWLRAAKTKDTEDRVFRLRSLQLVWDHDETLRQIDELLAQQRADGGWAQKDDMESDAYATGSVLVALLESGEQDRCRESANRAVSYLLKTQLEDGSWHVATRADGFQEYFESGFPHGEDQFISIAASSWATLGLAMSLPETDGD